MIIIEKLNLLETKFYSDLKIADKLKKKKDNFFYELKNITYNEHTKENIYHFYGFVIVGAKNLKHYFVSNDNSFEVY